MKFAFVSTDDVHPARTSYVLGLAPARNDDHFAAGSAGRIAHAYGLAFFIDKFHCYPFSELL